MTVFWFSANCCCISSSDAAEMADTSLSSPNDALRRGGWPRRDTPGGSGGFAGDLGGESARAGGGGAPPLLATRSDRSSTFAGASSDESRLWPPGRGRLSPFSLPYGLIFSNGFTCVCLSSSSFSIDLIYLSDRKLHNWRKMCSPRLSTVAPNNKCLLKKQDRKPRKLG